uniref:Uncharacterized protein n=1 Tax=Glossina austeni TaxID=7395 RepID=A0A1A9VE76_GLOAU
MIRPPIWPANLLQSIARYCFQTERLISLEKQGSDLAGVSKGKQQDETPFPASMSISSNSLHKSCSLYYQPHTPEPISLDGIEITLAPYAAK